MSFTSTRQTAYLTASGNHTVILECGLIAGIAIKALADLTVTISYPNSGTQFFTHFFDYSDDPLYVAPLIAPLDVKACMSEKERKEAKQIYGPNRVAVNVNLSANGYVEIYELVI